MMCQELTHDVLELARQSGEWHVAGLLFQCPGSDWRRQLADLKLGLESIELRDAVSYAIEEASESLYHTTFGPGGPAAPREVSHRQHPQPGQFLAQLATIYEAFAYLPALDEPLDHVAYEVGFVGYLRLKEAYARSAGKVGEAAACCQATDHFLRNHLSFLATPLAKSLEHSEITYLMLASRWLAAQTGQPATGNLNGSPSGLRILDETESEDSGRPEWCPMSDV
jgi:hypothetical protein